MTRIIILSDTHGDNQIIDKVLNDNEYDYAVLAGDYTCDSSFINQKFDFVVRGNNDFDNNPDELFFEIENIKFYLQHGHLIGTYSELDNYEYMKNIINKKNVDILIHGHTHISKIFKYENNKIVINPGSTTYPRGNSKKSYAIIVIDNNIVACDIINI